jgi:hypothetical protein
MRVWTSDDIDFFTVSCGRGQGARVTVQYWGGGNRYGQVVVDGIAAPRATSVANGNSYTTILANGGGQHTLMVTGDAGKYSITVDPVQ